VLDVRTPGEWDSGHIKGARHIPLPKLTGGLKRLPKDAPLAVICGSGYRSAIATSLLLARGFPRVQNVVGGMGAYQQPMRRVASRGSGVQPDGLRIRSTCAIIASHLCD
jgi:hydroxyacylglutathione hydrolase